MKTVTPAYGRDYKSAKEAKEDWSAGLDFIIQSYGDPYDGKPVNLQDARQAGWKQVMLRFNRLTKIAVVDV